MPAKQITKSSTWKRLLPALSFMAALILLMVIFYDAEEKKVAAPQESTAKARYLVAKNVFEELKNKDNVNRKQWYSLAGEFYDIYEEYETWPNRPAALFRSAAVLEILAKDSDDEEDYALAVNCYVKVAHEFRNSRLADDALLQAAILQSKELNDNAKALQLIKYMKTSFPKGDMYGAAIAFEKSISAGQDTSKKRLSAQQVALTQVTWSTLDKHTVQIVISLNKNTTWRVKKSKSGQQLFVTMDNTTLASGVHDGARVKNSVLKKLVITQGHTGATSLKLDFDKLSNYHTKIEKNPFRIVLVASTKPVMKEPKNTTVMANPDKSSPVPKLAQKKVNKQPTTETLSKRVNKANTNNMALQLGLNVNTVFIDVGHGGYDPGAVGNGIIERDVVLDTALQLGKILKANGLNVVYSRTSDKAIPLSTRPEHANKVTADVFVSIHVNANNDSRIHGFETYFLNFAKNEQAAQTAALENATSDRKLGDMQNLLTKVLLNVRTTESSDLADDVQRFTISKLRKSGFSTKDGGTRSAPFHVLIGTNMPAILVELGYCSNRNEANNLKKLSYRKILASGIANGILAYKNRFKKAQGLHFALTNK